MIEIKKNKVYENGQEIIQIDKSIVDFIRINEKTLIFLEENYEINNNVSCYSVDGQFMWRIQHQKYIHETCPATGIYLHEGALMVYHRCGIEEEIDILSGKVISSELIK